MDKEIKAYSLIQLEQLLSEMGQPKFRAMQLAQWLYGHHVSSYDDMTNLPKSLREELSTSHPLTTLSMKDKQISQDGSRKYVFSCSDGNLIESVALPDTSTQKEGDGRLTVCFSTQVGCAMGCTFCATGHEGFSRNLTIGEIVDQILSVEEDMNQRVSNVVAMGQGEPFLNYDAVLAALRIVNHPKLLKIGARRITVSTCGILSGIEHFSREPEQFTLAISLHSARQSVRNILMPHMENQPLSDLRKALQSYIQETSRRVTLEYMLIDGINDEDADLAALARFCNGLLAHVNLIPLNAVSSSIFQPSSSQTLVRWQKELERRNIETTIRKSRGGDIAAACGQLKNQLV